MNEYTWWRMYVWLVFFFFFFHSQCRVLIILGHLVYYCWILNKRYACVSYVCLRFIVLKMDCVEIHRKSSSVQHSKTIQKIRLVWHTNRILLLSTLFFFYSNRIAQICWEWGWEKKKTRSSIWVCFSRRSPNKECTI